MSEHSTQTDIIAGFFLKSTQPWQLYQTELVQQMFGALQKWTIIIIIHCSILYYMPNKYVAPQQTFSIYGQCFW